MRFVFLVAALATTTAAAAFAAEFEGEVTVRLMHVSQARLVTMLGAGATEPQKIFAVPVERFAAMKDQPDSGVDVQDLTFLARRGRLRINNIAPREPDDFVLIDIAKGTIAVVRPSQKSYAELSVAKIEADAGAAAEAMVRQQFDTLTGEKRARAEQFLKHRKDSAGAAVPTPVVQPLDKTQTIGGLSVSGYAIKSTEETAVGWVAKDSNNVTPIVKFFQGLERSIRSHPLQPAAAVVVLADYGIPMRTQVISANDYLIREVVSIKPKTVDASLLALPQGFTELKQRPSGGAAGNHAPQK